MDRPGLLLAIALGDAYGMGFEFAPKERIDKGNDLTRYFPHIKGTVKQGRYGDDAQMSIALAEFMLSKNPRTTIYLARSFVTAFRRDPRQGYSQGFYDILKTVKNGTELVQKLTPNSDKSGGAMRAAPCGMLPTVWQAMDLAMWQASVTHATRDGMNAAAAAAALVWACRNGYDLGYLATFLNEVVPGYPWETPWKGAIPNRGIPVVRAMLTVLMRHNTMAEMLKASVDFTGDTDTVAALVMAAAAMNPNVPCDLPDGLLLDLELDSVYGVSFLRALDDRLAAAFPVAPPAPDPFEVSAEDMEELVKFAEELPDA